MLHVSFMYKLRKTIFYLDHIYFFNAKLLNISTQFDITYACDNRVYLSIPPHTPLSISHRHINHMLIKNQHECQQIMHKDTNTASHGSHLFALNSKFFHPIGAQIYQRNITVILLIKQGRTN